MLTYKTPFRRKHNTNKFRYLEYFEKQVSMIVGVTFIGLLHHKLHIIKLYQFTKQLR
jgi:hypothetical protein